MRTSVGGVIKTRGGWRRVCDNTPRTAKSKEDAIDQFIKTSLRAYGYVCEEKGTHLTD